MYRNTQSFLHFEVNIHLSLGLLFRTVRDWILSKDCSFVQFLIPFKTAPEEGCHIPNAVK